MEPRLNVVIMFCPQFRPIVGGAERQAEKLAVALTEIGKSVTILTPRTDPSSPTTEETGGVRIIRFPLRDLSLRFPIPGVALLNVPYIVWQVVQRMRPYLIGADVLHCTIASLQTGGAALAGRLARVPVLCKAAIGSERSDFGAIEDSGPTGKLVAWLVRMAVQRWVATTAAVEAGLISAGIDPASIVRIPNGVQMPVKSTEGATGRIRRFLYLGRLSSNSRRDVPTLIAAFERLATTARDLELAIVGGGDLLNETRQLAESSAATERIHLPGFDEPEKWLAWADCFVLPSRREGLSNALLEAMAAGLPCIANDIPPNREVLDDGRAGLLVPVGDCEALYTAMKGLKEDPARASHFALEARRRVESCYSIDAVAQRHLKLYASMIGSRYQ